MIKNDRSRQRPSISERQNQNSKDLSFCVGHSLLTTQSVIWSLCFSGRGILFFFSPAMSWISVGFGRVCKLVLHIIKRKKKYHREGKQSEWKPCWDSVCLWHLLYKWCLTCFPYFPEWNFCCSPSLILQGCLVIRLTNTPSDRQGIFQGSKEDPYPLISPGGLEIVQEADVLYTENIPKCSPSLSAMNSLLHFPSESESQTSIFLGISEQILALCSYKPCHIHFHPVLQTFHAAGMQSAFISCK